MYVEPNWAPSWPLHQYNHTWIWVFSADIHTHSYINSIYSRLQFLIYLWDFYSIIFCGYHPFHMPIHCGHDQVDIHIHPCRRGVFCHHFLSIGYGNGGIAALYACGLNNIVGYISVCQRRGSEDRQFKHEPKAAQYLQPAFINTYIRGAKSNYRKWGGNFHMLIERGSWFLGIRCVVSPLVRIPVCGVLFLFSFCCCWALAR